MGRVFGVQHQHQRPARGDQLANCLVSLNRARISVTGPARQQPLTSALLSADLTVDCRAAWDLRIHSPNTYGPGRIDWPRSGSWRQENRHAPAGCGFPLHCKARLPGPFAVRFRHSPSTQTRVRARQSLLLKNRLRQRLRWKGTPLSFWLRQNACHSRTQARPGGLS